MATLNEITGALIEMNCHVQRTRLSNGLMVISFVLAFTSLIAVISYLDSPRRYFRSIILWFMLLLAGVSTFIYAYNMPTEKIISYCANGPVSIEEINAQYDIVEIDGKLIRLKERR